MSVGGADLVVVNGRVLTMDDDNPAAEAIAVKDGVIIAIGSRASIEELKGPATKIVDAQGGSVLPGFIEAHMHLFGGAAELDNLHLAGVHGFDALRDAIQDFAAKRPDAKLLIGAGVDYAILPEPVTRHDLDRIIPDRPFVMSASDHHTMWANTKALEEAGLLHGKEVGQGNEIVMGADGLAAGELRESEAFGPVLDHYGANRARLGLEGVEPDPHPSPSELAADRDLMHRGLEWCAKQGITSIQNMDGNFYQLELLADLEKEGRLLCRTKIPFHFKNFMKLDMLEKASRMAATYKSEWLSSGMVKVFYDGVLDSWTAVMVDDYADRPGWRGEPLFSPQHFAEVAVEADRRGLQIAVHSIGDGAVRAVLDGYQAAAKKNGRRDSRHRVEHIEVITAPDVPRFAELGVLASMQPAHPPGAMNFPLEPTISRIGRDKWPSSYAWRTLKNAGARVVFASDWPVSPVDPILSIQAAVMRKPWAEGMPDQSFSLREAIQGYTVEGAYAEFMEDRKGRLKTGYLADIVVLSADIEATAPEALHTVRPVTTICGGRVTYQA
ncbi:MULTISPECIES: amidohydrolase [unclassified Mesorhizobium]|uniref:amidohydrolase n=1 Tax=unclassified Mesorhizobium TaxID=325217 RepID=UPI000F7631C9|nr:MULTISPECIES: amidohydrolase [unclassified Mesorhizobium]AZO02833.1 amidohydrolase [Mesorhizobium sp. M2A.F.Ca.ET.043.02.1.1]RUW38990.1 amidohydrolase [Mesorhizobium sp. M2A.F.Ca.ET.015.02.1.1]RUW79401.1 amidohydrolase [Mesorhizobium sp. M2A.F.Ca.ET.067.02.1.1]RVC94629.1 amidohydrolase [Mesorhizobium sp. M2A.F.Ca.ET.017.03.2.1]RVD09761.1 amidohydrolase [Mesorhizobium sp. M2A.F.Ca.ET.029.05.1.1]